MVERRRPVGRLQSLQCEVIELLGRLISERGPPGSWRSDNGLKFVSKAVKAIDAAAAETRDVPLREALESARTTLAACLSLNGTMVPQQAQPRKSRGSGGMQVDPDMLLQYVRKNPGQRGEQISSALGTTSDAMRPAMKRLIEAGHVKVKGERRATSYSAA